MSATTHPHDQGLGQRVAALAADTPGRLRIASVAAVAICVVFAVAGFATVSNLKNSLDDAADHAAQLVRVQAIRTSLVAADASATNGFLIGGLEPVSVRDGYTAGIADAAAMIADASSAQTGDDDAFAEVNEALSVYTGTIESARANNRQGFPVGAAYLRDASARLQSDALPVLEQIRNREKRLVDDATATAEGSSAQLVVLLVATLIVLAAVQLYLFRKTRRVLNPPLVAATALVLVAGIVALLVTSWSESVASDTHDGAYAATVAIADARINALDAKSSESLTLIARGNGAAYEEHFVETSEAARSALTASPTGDADAARADEQVLDAFDAYVARHGELRALDDGGAYDEAVVIATNGDDNNSNALFASFDTLSNEALDARAEVVASELDRASAPLGLLAVAVAIAGLVAAVLAGRGFSIRLREYR